MLDQTWIVNSGKESFRTVGDCWRLFCEFENENWTFEEKMGKSGEEGFRCENQSWELVLFYIHIERFSHRIYIWFSACVSWCSCSSFFATSYSVLFFPVLWFSISCEHSAEDLALFSSNVFRTIQLWWKVPPKLKTSLQNDEILSKHL